MKKQLLLLSLIIFGIISCSDDTGDTLDLTVRTNDLSKMYGTGEKKWKITAYYSNYNLQELDETFNDCVQDDVYVFSKDTEDVEVSLGNITCGNVSDVKNEFAGGRYTHTSDNTLLLSFARSYEKEETGVSISRIMIIKCIHLSENKMIFIHGDVGDYIGIVFERVD
ncbi:hypothetical protein [Tenacibaculum agarivorans]|uniref:hypothetical protein n=1 Tax=Tenacibaculum agarivorans TaxID=1908389 RepID=UPI00094BBC7B|nr:hypothetical protein [Tenacibaculum agarivorans]